MTPLDARHWLHLNVFDTLGPLLRAPVREHLLPVELLRDYQFDLLRRVAAAMALGHRRILIVLPTGAGKTVMASAMIGCALAQLDRSQFIVHRKELIDQTSDTFTEHGLLHGFVASGRPPATAEDLVTLAGVQTLVRRLDLVLPSRLAIIDESHHSISQTWATILDHYSQQDCFLVGLTATPERLDGKGLSDQFDVMIVGPSTGELIDAGYLSEFDYYAPGVPDLSGIHTTAGDFNRGELDDLMNEPKLIGDVVDHYRRLADGEQGIVFATSRLHSSNIATAFQQAGIGAEHVDGSMSDAHRKAVVQAHRKGELQIMTNVELFGEGFDVPAVAYVGCARPTKSLGLHLQQVGRGLRISPGKPRAVICDHAGNAFQHGLPDQAREWSLEGRKGRSASGTANSDSIPIHQCETCFRVTPSSVKVCPGCETPFPVKVQAPPKSEAGELAKLERVEKAKNRKMEEGMCSKYEDFLRLAISRGYAKPQGWARLRMSMRSRGRRL